MAIFHSKLFNYQRVMVELMMVATATDIMNTHGLLKKNCRGLLITHDGSVCLYALVKGHIDHQHHPRMPPLRDGRPKKTKKTWAMGRDSATARCFLVGIPASQ